MRTWAAFRDGEILFQVTGPDAEQLARAAGADRVAYCEPVKPSPENGWALAGPWVDVP